MPLKKTTPSKPRPSAKRTRDLLLRLWPEEYEAVRREAEARALPVTTYLRQLIRDAHRINPSR